MSLVAMSASSPAILSSAGVPFSAFSSALAAARLAFFATLLRLVAVEFGDADGFRSRAGRLRGVLGRQSEALQEIDLLEDFLVFGRLVLPGRVQAQERQRPSDHRQPSRVVGGFLGHICSMLLQPAVAAESGNNADVRIWNLQAGRIGYPSKRIRFQALEPYLLAGEAWV